MNWLEASIFVEGEIAEAAAEVLARYAPNGVIIESTEICDQINGEGYPTGPFRVCGYIPVDRDIESTQIKIEQAFWYLSRIKPIPQPTFTVIKEDNWIEKWKAHYQPIPIGKTLLIIPAWLDSIDNSRIPIRIDPGMAFGTGTHPTTRLCLELLEADTIQNEIVLDVGCGSGILSIAAVRLGAKRSYGVDIDEDAVLSAKRNARINNVHDLIQFAPGSVLDIKNGLFNIKQSKIVLANLLTHILIKLFDDGLKTIVAPGGKLILSGILEDQVGKIQSIADSYSLRCITQRQIDDWIGLVLQHY
jgi:ribosomal protein L11 methyltransferase